MGDMLYPSTLAQVEGANNPQPGEAMGPRADTVVATRDSTDAVSNRSAKIGRDTAGNGFCGLRGGFL